MNKKLICISFLFLCSFFGGTESHAYFDGKLLQHIVKSFNEGVKPKYEDLHLSGTSRGSLWNCTLFGYRGEEAVKVGNFILALELHHGGVLKGQISHLFTGSNFSEATEPTPQYMSMELEEFLLYPEQNEFAKKDQSGGIDIFMKKHRDVENLLLQFIPTQLETNSQQEPASHLEPAPQPEPSTQQVPAFPLKIVSPLKTASCFVAEY